MVVPEALTSKEKLMTLSKLIVNCCSHEEINILCIALLDANLRCEIENKREGEKR